MEKNEADKLFWSFALLFAGTFLAGYGFTVNSPLLLPGIAVTVLALILIININIEKWPAKLLMLFAIIVLYLDMYDLLRVHSGFFRVIIALLTVLVYWLCLKWRGFNEIRLALGTYCTGSVILWLFLERFGMNHMDLSLPANQIIRFAVGTLLGGSCLLAAYGITIYKKENTENDG